MFLQKKFIGEVQIYEDYQEFVFFRYVLNNKPKMLMTCHMFENEIHINDIKPYHKNKRNKYVNKGYGSKLMSALLDYAKKNGIAEITGDLSIVDLDHKKRLHHFYQKFGFKITTFAELNGCYYGCISKNV